MASNEPQNLSEWQLHCVLKRANLLQYYESFIKHGECDVLQLSKAEDGEARFFNGRKIQERISMYLATSRNMMILQRLQRKEALKPGTVSFSMTGKSSDVPKLKTIIQDIKTKEKEELTSYKSEKKKTHPKEDTTQKYTQSVIKDQEHHEHHDLTGYYDELLDNTVLDKMVLDNLISRCILMIEDREEIVKPTTQRERNKVLLDILTERPYPTFHLFKDVLLESEPSNSCVKELVKKMMSTESRDAHISWQGHEIELNKHKVKLQKNYMMFVHGVDSKTDIADHLYQSDVLSTEEKEEICNSSLTQQESNRLLYNKLIRKGGEAFTHLLGAVKHGKYQDVASEIEKTELSDKDIQLCQIDISSHDEVIPKHILGKCIDEEHCNFTKFYNTASSVHKYTCFDWLLTDWENGFVYSVCQNRNINSTAFTENLVTHLNQLDLSKQQELVSTKDIHMKDIALSGSCYMGTVYLVKWLITDVNKCSNDGTPPLQIACYNNMIEVVRVLLQCDDVDIDLCDDDGCSSLYLATDVNKCSNDGTPPLQIACYNNMIEVVRVLLHCDDVDIDLCDDDGCSSLYLASQNGHVDVVKELLQHSADVNKCDFKGKSSLNVAQEKGHIEIESLLKGKGLNQLLCQNDHFQ
ncbi:ANKRD50 [Mytilus edulis]|uniref:ANKRD50 n=1 Tax=Mytilus edulis TaxID=6550 RepID=A0A8S3QZQ3_MYTED|nr:ANKRD50 [Mytilus edulis]